MSTIDEIMEAAMTLGDQRLMATRNRATRDDVREAETALRDMIADALAEAQRLPTGERQAVLLTDEQIAWARLGPLIDKHQIGISTPRNMVHRNGGPNAGWGDSGFWGGTAWTHGLARRPAVSGKSSALEVVTELAAALAANGLEVRRG